MTVSSTAAASLRVFLGTVIHSISLSNLSILNPGLIGIHANGRIVFLEDVEDQPLEAVLKKYNVDVEKVRQLI